ncbi:hypothetical protein KJ616_00690 [Patescibacteria group bacterium]|nr:hypothetical protein [Patescibacteria group bacterium]
MLDKKRKYLQIALNSTLQDAQDIILKLPIDERIIIEAGTPLIKNYGGEGIQDIRRLWEQRIAGKNLSAPPPADLMAVFRLIKEIRRTKQAPVNNQKNDSLPVLYIIADLKCMDRGFTEVDIAKSGGASAATVLGQAPIETINVFIEKCEESGLDSMVDMMNVGYPLGILGNLNKQPDAVILHRGVDEEDYNREKEIPYHEIQRIKSDYDIMVAVAGGDTIQEVQTAILNDVDIIVLWRAFYKSTEDTIKLVEEFLKEIR